MNADAFRYLYEYHFKQNRYIWDHYILPLSDAHFIQDSDYSIGSVRNHIVHLINVDHAWFSDLQGTMILEDDLAKTIVNRNQIRAAWDKVEEHMQSYLDALTDDMLLGKPFSEGEDKALILWQVLLHVVNHGTDHRAQMLRLLHDVGVKTTAQDFVFYVYEHSTTD